MPSKEYLSKKKDYYLNRIISNTSSHKDYLGWCMALETINNELRSQYEITREKLDKQIVNAIRVIAVAAVVSVFFLIFHN